MIEPTEADIGREVIYQGGHPDDRESGVISSFNDKFVFVRYRARQHGEATSREHLTWAHPKPSSSSSGNGSGDEKGNEDG